MAKHKDIVVDLDKPYEENVIGMRGIIYFGAGLFLLIVVTFGLMWFLLEVMEDDAAATKASENPLKLTKLEALPPEPRLQAAPGFGIDLPTGGRTNLELLAPQAEYRELLKQWEDLWLNGQKDPQTGTVISLPVKDAKARLLEQHAGANKAATGSESLDQSRMMVSDAGAGRNASVRIR